ncbi:MAG TPA: ammonium transporter [Polyangiaceae bacterium]|nr:ammonium transporter [Polyangiaceae bacterium]
MSALLESPAKLSLALKFSRLGGRLRDPEWRRFGRNLLLGKFLGLMALALAILAFHYATLYVSGTPAYAEPAPAAGSPVLSTDLVDMAKNPMINPINTMWVLLGAFLVFGMQAGFTMLEAGMCRNRETVNVLVECVFDTCVCGLLHWAFGFAFMFGGGNAFIGWHMPGDPTKSMIFMKDVSVLSVYGATGIPIVAHYVFQFAFADCASTICSGAMVGRTRFVGDVIYSIGVSGIIYPIFGHWCWGPDGFLATMGSEGGFLASLGMNFHDFAGSTVVHSIGGWVAIAGAICLGPRLGRKFKRDGGGPMLPHDLTIAVIGGLILWFGWYGFNPCSTLSIMDNAGAGRVAMNTTLAACTGGIAAVFVVFFMVKKWDTAALVNGFLAGLVAITCPCYWVSDVGACILGAVAGVLVILGMELLEHLRIDDPVGAWPVHGLCGIWGTLSLGLFASGQYSAAGSSPTGVPDIIAKSPQALTGLFYGGGMAVLKAQAIGSLIVCSATFVAAMVMFKALNAVNLLRVSMAGEIEGFDLDQHGASAYPEFVISTRTAGRAVDNDMEGSAGMSAAEAAGAE